MASDNPMDGIFAILDSQVSEQLERLRKAPKPSPLRKRIDKALDDLIQQCDSEAKAAREVTNSAVLVDVLSAIAPKAATAEVQSLKTTMESVEFNAVLWEKTAQSARGLKAVLAENIVADQGQMIDLAEQFLAAIRSLRVALADPDGPT